MDNKMNIPSYVNDQNLKTKSDDEYNSKELTNPLYSSTKYTNYFIDNKYITKHSNMCACMMHFDVQNMMSLKVSDLFPIVHWGYGPDMYSSIVNISKYLNIESFDESMINNIVYDKNADLLSSMYTIVNENSKTVEHLDEYLNVLCNIVLMHGYHIYIYQILKLKKHDCKIQSNIHIREYVIGNRTPYMYMLLCTPIASSQQMYNIPMLKSRLHDNLNENIRKIVCVNLDYE